MLQKLKILQKNLINIYLCKKARFTGELKYPFSILPKTKFKLEINFDELISDGQVYFLRRSQVPQIETFHIFNDGTSLLNDDAADLVRIPNFSINLMGSLFKTHHSIFIPINNGSKTWKGEKVYLSDHFDDYKLDNENGYFFIHANKIHNIKVPYNLKFNNEFHKEVEKFIRTVGSNNVLSNTPPEDIIIKGKIYFEHVPVNLNYWHAELKTVNYKEKSLKDAKSVSDKRFIEVIFNDYIKLNSYPNVQELNEINKSLYTA